MIIYVWHGTYVEHLFSVKEKETLKTHLFLYEKYNKHNGY